MKQNTAKPEAFEDVTDCLIYIFKTQGKEILKEKARFLSVFFDYMPERKLEKNLLNMLLSSIDCQSLFNLNRRDIDQKRTSAGLYLTNQYGISRENADMVSACLFDALYGKEPVIKAKARASAQAPQSVSKARYTGATQNGVPHGKGTIVYPNGEKIAGDWADGKLNGYAKHYNSDNLVVYEGEFKDHLKHGKGKQYSFDAATLLYDGEWKNGLKHGKGTFYDTHGSVVYDGEYENDKRTGKGILYSGNRIVYSGSFKNGEFCGKGISFHFCGSIAYSGEWKNSKPHGFGASFNEDGSTDKQGRWKDGVFSGEV